MRYNHRAQHQQSKQVESPYTDPVKQYAAVYLVKFVKRALRQSANAPFIMLTTTQLLCSPIPPPCQPFIQQALKHCIKKAPKHAPLILTDVLQLQQSNEGVVRALQEFLSDSNNPNQTQSIFLALPLLQGKSSVPALKQILKKLNKQGNEAGMRALIFGTKDMVLQSLTDGGVFSEPLKLKQQCMSYMKVAWQFTQDNTCLPFLVQTIQQPGCDKIISKSVETLKEFVKYQKQKQTLSFFIEHQQILLQLIIKQVQQPLDCKVQDQVLELNDLCHKQDYKTVKCSYMKLLFALAEHSDGFLTKCFEVCTHNIMSRQHVDVSLLLLTCLSTLARSDLIQTLQFEYDWLLQSHTQMAYMFIGYYSESVLDADRCDSVMTYLLQSMQHKDAYQALYTFQQLQLSTLFVARIEVNFDLIVQALANILVQNRKIQFIEFVIEFVQSFKLNFTQDNYELLLGRAVSQVLSSENNVKTQKMWGVIQYIVEEAQYNQQIETILKPLLQTITTGINDDQILELICCLLKKLKSTNSILTDILSYFPQMLVRQEYCMHQMFEALQLYSYYHTDWTVQLLEIIRKLCHDSIQPERPVSKLENISYAHEGVLVLVAMVINTRQMMGGIVESFSESWVLLHQASSFLIQLDQIKTRTVLGRFDAKLQAVYLIQNLHRLDINQLEVLVSSLESLSCLAKNPEDWKEDVSNPNLWQHDMQKCLGLMKTKLNDVDCFQMFHQALSQRPLLQLSPDLTMRVKHLLQTKVVNEEQEPRRIVKVKRT